MLSPPEALRHLAAALLTIALLVATASAQSEPGAVQGILRVIPPDVHAALIVPSIKRASDDLTRLLEGMDRANLLLGLRPIDQFKSMTGFTNGLDDHGSVAIVFTDVGDLTEARPARWVVILPVADAQEFIAANLPAADGGEPDARRLGSGAIVYVKTLSAHVIMGDDPRTVREYAERDGFEPTLSAALGGGGDNVHADIFTRGEFGIIVRQPAIAAIKSALLSRAAAAQQMLPAAAMIASEVADDTELLAMSIDCDPLAIIVRSFIRFRDGADFGSLAPADPPTAGPGLSRLPSKPYALAVSVNLAAMGGEGLLRGLAKATGEQPDAVPAWLTKTDNFQFAIAPSPAGAAGGLLNEAVLVLAGGDPTGVRDSIKHEITALADHPTIEREAEWTNHQKLNGTNGSLVANAWEVRTISAPPELAQVEVMERLLFGTAGMRGYIRQEDGATIMTFSQRPAILEALSQAVQQAAGPEAGKAGLGGSAAVRTMRAWMPSQRDVEAYVFAGAAQQMLAPFVHDLPQFSSGLPPVGMAMDVMPRQFNAAMIMPAGVLAPLFDAFAHRLPIKQQPDAP